MLDRDDQLIGMKMIRIDDSATRKQLALDFLASTHNVHTSIGWWRDLGLSVVWKIITPVALACRIGKGWGPIEQ